MHVMYIYGTGLDIGYVPAGPDAFLGGRASSGHNNWFSTGPPGQ